MSPTAIRQHLALTSSFLVVGVFAVDVLSPAGVEVEFLYTLVVLLSAWSPHRRLTLVLASCAAALALLGYFATPLNSAWEAGFVFRLLAVGVIWATTAVVLQHKQTQLDGRHFFTLSTEMFCVIGRDGSLQRLNTAFATTLGYTIAIDKSYLEFIHPEDQDKTRAALTDPSPYVVANRHENRCRCKDGSYRWLRWRYE